MWRPRGRLETSVYFGRVDFHTRGKAGARVHMAGQGALGLTATTAVALWFTRRRGTAMGLVSAIGASTISLTPMLLASIALPVTVAAFAVFVRPPRIRVPAEQDLDGEVSTTCPR